jgi:hypothetical protein
MKLILGEALLFNNWLYKLTGNANIVRFYVDILNIKEINVAKN